jgi:phage shock protein PspC (stress-responsive transcriptional regulator)
MRTRLYRPDEALLAGVCAEAARRLGWNVWALRVVLLFGLFLAPVPVGIAYLVAAVAMGLLLGRGATPARSSPGASTRRASTKKRPRPRV